MLTRDQNQSPLFRLPAEVRFNVYHYLIPDNILHIDLCSSFAQSGSSAGSYIPGNPSPISQLLAQTLALNEITRINGLHLLLVCRRTRAEALSLLSKTTVRFHCPDCFKSFLPNVARGLGVGVEWMKRLEIVLDMSLAPHELGYGRGRRPGMHSIPGYRQRREDMTTSLGKTMAREAMQSCQKIGWYWYGRLDLREQEKWGFEPMKEEKSDDDVVFETLGPITGNAVLGFGGGPPLNLGLGPTLHNASNGVRVEEPPKKWLITARFDI